MSNEQPNERGSYGEPTEPEEKRVGAGGIAILFGVTVMLYALSPGARHFYKHGYLPKG
jgi:hypothetical protein